MSDLETHISDSTNLDDVFINMSTLVAHQLIRDGIAASVPHDASKLRQICMHRNSVSEPSDETNGNDSLNM